MCKNDHGKFRDVATQAGVEDIGPGMSAAWFDYDGDGQPDLYVGNMWSAAGQRVAQSKNFPAANSPALTEAYRGHSKGNSLYRNLGNGPEIFVVCGMLTNNLEPDLISFFWRQVVAKSPGDEKPAAAYENGWNALNQFIHEGYSWNGQERNIFFMRKDGQYRDFSGVSGLDVAEDGRAFAVTDLAGDGSLDIILKSRLGPQVRVFENRCAGKRNRIVLRLRGVKSNRDAVGARVAVDGQVKWLAAGSGYLSQHTKQLHFGLGDRETAGQVTIGWPSGSEQTFGPLKAGYVYDLVEEQREFSQEPLRHSRPAQRVLPVLFDNRPSLQSSWFIEPIPLPDQRPASSLVTITDGEPADTLAAYSIFRRYLFEWRTSIDLPLFLLVDEKGRARKIYSRPPTARDVDADLRSAGKPLPFEGRYHVQPRRDFFKFGAALLSTGYPRQTQPYLEAVLGREPNVRTMVLLAQIQNDASHTAEARKLLKQAPDLDPQSAEAWSELGTTESMDGRTDVALRCFLKALDIKSDLDYATVNAQAYAVLADNVNAERFYRRALVLDPKLADAVYGLGLALAKQNRPAEAKTAFEHAIELRPQFGSAINNLGVLYTSMGDIANAIAVFRYGTQTWPDDDTLQMNLASAYVQKGERKKARQVVQQWLDRKPGNQQALRALRALSDPR